ncbi:MAG: hypothetical protein ACJ8GN_27525 [Longimicrobiaceae bacterium]
MDYLRSFAEEYGLSEIVRPLAERPEVQGVILTLDDWWLNAWRLNESGQTNEWYRWFREWRRWGPGAFPFMIGSEIGMNDQSWIPLRPPDLNWRPPFWDDLCRMLGRVEETPPVRLIVCLRPPANGENVVIPELPRSRLPVIFEGRPLARLSANPRAATRPIVGGLSIGAGARAYGTLGGIVEDISGVRYGMTCAHVLPPQTPVEQPAQHDDAHASAIGTSAKSIDLQPCPGPGPCNAYTSSPHISLVDTRLVELESGVAADLEILSIGPLAGVVAKNTMTPGQEITFVGRTSSHRIAEVGGLALFYRLRMNGQTYCFNDLFEVRWRSFIRACLGPVVQAGDSGAWVCAETSQGPGWCGQVIGEDRRVGYAAFAENTITAWAKAGKHVHVI